MKIISKEKAWIGYDINNKYYCFEEVNYNYDDSGYNDYKIFLSDITVNEDNEIHSFNDQPALIYKDYKNRLYKEWFINGKLKRLNTEKPCCIIKGYAYYFNNGKKIDIQMFKDNIK